MTIEQDKVLPWLKWFTKDAKNYREVFNNEQMGELFFAAMKTVENNEKVEVSSEIKFAYLQLCTTIDEARTAYFKKCETNARNGAKGGKAKAAKAEVKKDEFKPPSKTDFKNIAKHICKEYSIEDCDQYTINNMFEELTKNNWCFDEIPIASKAILECIVFCYLTKEKITFDLLRESLICGHGKEFTDIDFFTEELLGFYDWDKKHFYIAKNNYVNTPEFVRWFFSSEE